MSRQNLLAAMSRSVRARVWDTPLVSISGWRRVIIRSVRILHMVIRELVGGDLSLRAGSLVFTTVLALVPLLAVSFSVLKGFGVHNRMDGLLFNLISPLGEQGEEFALRIIEAVDRVEVRVLGTLGLVVLFITVLSLVYKAESSLNHIWRVRRTRGLVQRFSGYLSVILVGPLLVVAAMGTEIVQRIAASRPFGADPALLSQLVPHLLLLGAFTFAYQIIPNTRVKPRSALLGGLVAVGLWTLAGWGFASFVVNPATSSYAALYSGFAIVFFFILWLYVAWLIVLVGGTVAFYDQHPEYLGRMPHELHISNTTRERIALGLLVRVGRAHLAGEPPPPAHGLAREMALPAVIMDETVSDLLRAGFLVETEGHAGLIPARDVGHVRLADVMRGIRTVRRRRSLTVRRLPDEPEAAAVMKELDAAAARVLGERTLESLILAGQQHGPDRHAKSVTDLSPGRHLGGG